METSAEEIRAKQWFQDFISYFRTEFERLASEARALVLVGSNYLPSCQIEILWLRQPSYQFIIKSNFDDLADKQVVVHGPVSPEDFLAIADEVVSSQKWNRPISTRLLPQEVSGLYSETLASHLNNAMSNIRNSVFNPKPKPGYAMTAMIGDKGWFEMYAGNIFETDYVQMANSKIEPIRASYEASLHQPKAVESPPPKPSQHNDPVNSGFVTFFYPPVDLSTRQKPSPSAILRGVTFDFSWFEKAFGSSFNGIPVIVNKNGLIFVATNDRETALRMLNTMMAVATLQGLSLYAVREHEIGQGNFDKERMTIAGHSYPISTVRMMQNDLFSRPYIQATKIEPARLEAIIQTAAKSFRNHKLVEELRLFVEAHTHFNDAEYAQSFILSWSIIERHLYELWARKLEDMDMDEDRIGKLRNQSIDYLIEVLSVAGDMNESDYEGYMELKGKRNKFMHRGKAISKEDAEKCLGLARSIVQKKLPA